MPLYLILHAPSAFRAAIIFEMIARLQGYQGFRFVMPDVIIRALVMVFLGLTPASTALAAGMESEKQYVVILNSNDAYLPAFRALDAALQTSILKNSEKPVDFIGEALDMKRFPRAQINDEFIALYRNKYRNFPVAVVVAVDTEALEFAQQQGPIIWPIEQRYDLLI